MDKFNKFLDFIMTDKTASIIFYVILGSLALLFLVLIISTISSIVKKDSKKELDTKDDKVNESKDDVILKEESNDIEEKDTLTETMTFNDMLMNKDSSDEDIKSSDDPLVYLDKSEDIKSDYNEIIDKNDSLKDTNDGSDIEKVLNDSVNEEKSIGELLSINEDIPALEPADISGIDDSTPNKDEELPLEVKPKFNEDEESKLTEVVSEKKDFVSNDELRSRLEKLKGLHNKSTLDGKEVSNETESIDKELENIMKSVGLEDTMVIPNLKSEEKILGK